MARSKNKVTRHSANYTASYVPLVKKDYSSLARFEEERRRQRNFAIGSFGAAAALCVLFLVLSVGVVMFGW